MKRLFVLFAGLAIGSLLMAQDIIFERNGVETQVIVTEVTSTEVVFKMFGSPDGPTMRMKLGYIHKIVYEGGQEKTYSQMYKDAGRDYTTIRNPGLAALFSFLLPGAGQFYNKDYGKAGIMAGLYVAAGITALVCNSNCNYYYDMFHETDDYYYQDKGEIYEGVLSAMIFVGGPVLLWALIDAPVRAGVINKRYDLVNNHLFENDKIGLDIDPYLATHSLTPGFNQPVYGVTFRLTLK